MGQWFRRIRGAIGVGIIWGVVWGLVGGVVEAIFGLPPGASGVGAVLQEFARGFGALAAVGFMGSGLFSLALGLEGRRRSFAEMSVPRFALMGGLAGLGVGLVLYSPHILLMGINAGLGATTAAGSLVLARRVDDRELLGSGDEIAGIGLTDQESRELLG